jgi:hypothetical protein
VGAEELDAASHDIGYRVCHGKSNSIANQTVIQQETAGAHNLSEHEERTMETRRGLHNCNYHIYTFVWLCMSKDWDWGARFPRSNN